MRMIDDEQDLPVNRLWLYLTESEAVSLAEALRHRLEDPDPQWHAHIDSDHGDGKSLTVAVYNPASVPDDPKIGPFLERDEWRT
jgi:hypothetical protein